MKNTYTTPADFWQERDFGAKISAAFEFIGAHWRPLGRVLLYLAVPFALVRGIVAVLLQPRITDTIQQSRSNGSFSIYTAGFQSPWSFLNAIMGGLFYTVLILSVYGYLSCCVYAEQPGAPVTVPQVWEVVKSRLVGTYFSLIGIWLLIVFGFICLFVPGVYLVVTLSLFFAVSVLENSEFMTAISRCIELIKGKWWSTCGLLFIMGILFYLVFASLGVLAVLMGGVKSLLFSSGSGFSLSLIVITAVSGVLSVFFYVPLMLVLAFQYFNLVERREGVGLRLLVNQLGDDQAAMATKSENYQPEEEGEY